MTAEERQHKEEKLAKLKEELKDVHGTKCNVYSRVVGYLRPVQNWNDGKIEEYRLRKNYDVANGATANSESNVRHTQTMAKMNTVSSFRNCCK